MFVIVRTHVIVDMFTTETCRYITSTCTAYLHSQSKTGIAHFTTHTVYLYVVDYITGTPPMMNAQFYKK